VVKARWMVKNKLGKKFKSEILNVYDALIPDYVRREQRSRSEYNNLTKFFDIPKKKSLMRMIKNLGLKKS
jgi:hypothetical protein